MKLPQLTLRDLLWLVLVVRIALGWWLEYERNLNWLPVKETGGVSHHPYP
jgi:hypothetical protein